MTVRAPTAVRPEDAVTVRRGRCIGGPPDESPDLDARPIARATAGAIATVYVGGERSGAVMAPHGRPSHPVFAALYDPITAIAERSIFLEHREYLARGLAGRVLDLGAGTGAMLRPFAAAAEAAPSLAVHVIEPDPSMRRRAEQTAAGLDLDVAFADAVAERLPYVDGAFDAVVASLVLCTVADVPAALGEVHRVLDPAGELRVFEHVSAEGAAGRIQSVVAPAWKRVAAGCHLDRRTGEALAESDRFEPLELDRLAIGVPPVRPFVRGRFVPRDPS